MSECQDALARLAENLLERLRSEEEPGAETLAAARIVGRWMRASGITATCIVRGRLRPQRNDSGNMEAAEARIAALECVKLDLEQTNTTLRRQRDRAWAERHSAETRIEMLQAELGRARGRAKAEPVDRPDHRRAKPKRIGDPSEHAQRTCWRIQAVQRDEPLASLDTLASVLNQQGWSTGRGLPWTRDSIRDFMDRLERR